MSGNGESGNAEKLKGGPADWFRILSTAPDPDKRIRDLTDGGLAAAIAESEAVERPNQFQAEIYARCIHEAVRRWRCEKAGA